MVTSALAWLASMFGALTGASWLPAIGGGLLAAIKYVWQGVFDCLTHPASLTIIGLAAFGGYMEGHARGTVALHHLQAQLQVQNERAQKSLVAAQLAAASAARAEAERDAMLKSVAAKTERVEIGEPPREPIPRRVRKVAKPPADGFSLFGLPASWGAK